MHVYITCYLVYYVIRFMMYNIFYKKYVVYAVLLYVVSTCVIVPYTICIDTYIMYLFIYSTAFQCSSFRIIFPEQQLLEFILPFLSSFLNSAPLSLRLAFCRKVCHILPACSGNASDTNEVDYDKMLRMQSILLISTSLIICLEGALGDPDELVVIYI